MVYYTMFCVFRYRQNGTVAERYHNGSIKLIRLKECSSCTLGDRATKILRIEHAISFAVLRVGATRSYAYETNAVNS
jgi:hypothetical protein